MNELRVGAEAVLPAPPDAAAAVSGRVAGATVVAGSAAGPDSTPDTLSGPDSAATPLWASVAARKAGLRRHRQRLRKRLLIGVGLVLAVAVLGQIRGMLPQGVQDGVRSHATAVSALPVSPTPAVH